MSQTIMPVATLDLSKVEKASRELMLHIFHKLNAAKIKARRDSFLDSQQVKWSILAIPMGSQTLFLDSGVTPESSNLTVVIRTAHVELTRWSINSDRLDHEKIEEVFEGLLDSFRNECRHLGDQVFQALAARLQKSGVKIQEECPRINSSERRQTLRLVVASNLRVEVASSKSGLGVLIRRNGQDVKYWPVGLEYFDIDSFVSDILVVLVPLAR